MERKNQVRTNFIYPTIDPKQRVYGSSFLSRPIVKSDGDYRKNLPPEEEQRRFGIEPSTCFLFAQTHADATYEEAVYNEKDNNYAERFPAQFSNSSPNGGDPLIGADVIYDYGSVKEESMPFTEDILSFEEYMSWKGVDKNKVIAEGKADKAIKSRYGVVIFEKDTPLETKYTILAEALKRGVPNISLWGVTDGDTYAVKPPGVHDTHLVEVTYVDKENKIIHILDTYKPFQKALPANYNPDFGMVRYVDKKKYEVQISILQKILDICRKILGLDKEIIEQLPVKPIQTPKIDASAKLKQLCIDSVGHDISPYSNELGCADSVSTILKSIYPDFTRTLSTTALFEQLKNDKRIKATLEIKPWEIIISPTGYGKGDIKHGHCGIIGENSVIYSNNSENSLWEKTHTVGSWVDYYRVKGKYPIFLFDVL